MLLAKALLLTALDDTDENCSCEFEEDAFGDARSFHGYNQPSGFYFTADIISQNSYKMYATSENGSVIDATFKFDKEHESSKIRFIGPYRQKTPGHSVTGTLDEAGDETWRGYYEERDGSDFLRTTFSQDGKTLVNDYYRHTGPYEFLAELAAPVKFDPADKHDIQLTAAWNIPMESVRGSFYYNGYGADTMCEQTKDNIFIRYDAEDNIVCLRNGATGHYLLIGTDTTPYQEEIVLNPKGHYIDRFLDEQGILSARYYKNHKLRLQCEYDLNAELVKAVYISEDGLELYGDYNNREEHRNNTKALICPHESLTPEYAVFPPTQGSKEHLIAYMRHVHMLTHPPQSRTQKRERMKAERAVKKSSRPS